jgi:hypothetical protein
MRGMRSGKYRRYWILCLVIVVVGVGTVRFRLSQTSSGPWSIAASMPTAKSVGKESRTT